MTMLLIDKDNRRVLLKTNRRVDVRAPTIELSKEKFKRNSKLGDAFTTELFCSYPTVELYTQEKLVITLGTAAESQTNLHIM